MATKTKTSRQAELQKVLAGIAKRYQGVSSITFGGATYAIVDLVKLFQGELDSISVSAKAKAEYAAKLQLERNVRALVSPTLRRFKNYVLATVGDAQDAISELEDFGFTPRKTTKVPVAVKAEAQDKARATRKARGTKGRKAKAKITGTVPANGAGAPPPPTPKA